MRSDEELAARVAADIQDRTYVNLGVGLPQQVPGHLAPDRDVMFHSENGILGIAGGAAPGEEDWELIDAGKRAVTMREGGCFFHHADSFAMVRGKHLDLTVLGAYEVSADGDLANWWTGSSETIPAVGGAMDLAVGARAVYVMMRHVTRSGMPRLRAQCALPLTGRRVVTRIYTELCVAEPRGAHFDIVELAPGVTAQQIADATEADVTFSCLSRAAS